MKGASGTHSCELIGDGAAASVCPGWVAGRPATGAVQEGGTYARKRSVFDIEGVPTQGTAGTKPRAGLIKRSDKALNLDNFASKKGEHRMSTGPTCYTTAQRTFHTLLGMCRWIQVRGGLRIFPTSPPISSRIPRSGELFGLRSSGAGILWRGLSDPLFCDAWYSTQQTKTATP